MTDRKSRLDAVAAGWLVACCGFWGLQQILIKSTVTEVPPLWQASLRFAGATVLLALWCAWRRVPLLARDGTLLPGLLAGLLFCAEFTCIYLGLRDTTASRLTVFLYTAPFWLALLLPRLVPAERLRAPQWGGLVLAFCGVALAFTEGLVGPQAAPNQLRGDLLALGGGAFWGLTTLVIRASRLGSVSAEKTLFYQVAVTAIAAPGLSLALGETWSLAYSAGAWTSILLQTVVGAFASYLAWMWLLRHYPATRVTSFVFFTPLFALAFGALLLAEPLTPLLLLGLTGVAAGIVLVNRRSP